ncbi:hypothetical protein pb186bvf_013893 [Paramecium bursaria]
MDQFMRQVDVRCSRIGIYKNKCEQLVEIYLILGNNSYLTHFSSIQEEYTKIERQLEFEAIAQFSNTIEIVYYFCSSIVGFFRSIGNMISSNGIKEQGIQIKIHQLQKCLLAITSMYSMGFKQYWMQEVNKQSSSDFLGDLFFQINFCSQISIIKIIN